MDYRLSPEQEALKQEFKEKAQRQELYDQAEINKIKAKFKKELNKEAAMKDLEDEFWEVYDEIFQGKDVVDSELGQRALIETESNRRII